VSLRKEVVGMAVMGAVLAGGAALAVTGGGGEELPTVVLTARHSRFSPAVIAVERGTEVRFVVRNADPIAHELIVGPAEVHDRHERGTEAAHGAVPGEVSVAPGAEATTTYVFDRDGTVVFACHLPGHFDYGMQGEVRVG
jgi:uncharacterized cupredoxin-like copper-binding protein